MKKSIIAFLIAFLSISFHTVYGASGDSDTQDNPSSKTILELKSDIHELNEAQSDLAVQLKRLNANQALEGFFKKPLSTEEKQSLGVIVNKYVSDRSSINAKTRDSETIELIEQQKRDLLLLKKELYKSLLPFIDESQIDNYLEYIKGDAKIFQEKKDVSKQIIEKQTQLQTKVDKIESKIKQYNKYFSDSVQVAMEKRIDEKIQLLFASEKYKNLSLEKQKEVFGKMILKLEERIKKLDEKSEISEKKRAIYELVLSRLRLEKEKIK